MNYQKYRSAAKAIFTIPFLIALIAAGVYWVLTDFEFINAPFEWEYLAALGSVVAIAAFLAFWLLCISCSLKKRAEKQSEQEEEQVMDACAEYAAEPEYVYIQQPPYLPKQKQSLNFNLSFGNKASSAKKSAKIPPEKLKKAAMIAIPTVAVATGVSIALAAKVRKKRKIKQLIRDLEHLLGYRK